MPMDFQMRAKYNRLKVVFLIPTAVIVLRVISACTRAWARVLAEIIPKHKITAVGIKNTTFSLLYFDPNLKSEGI